MPHYEIQAPRGLCPCCDRICNITDVPDTLYADLTFEWDPAPGTFSGTTILNFTLTRSATPGTWAALWEGSVTCLGRTMYFRLLASGTGPNYDWGYQLYYPDAGDPDGYVTPIGAGSPADDSRIDATPGCPPFYHFNGPGGVFAANLCGAPDGQSALYTIEITE